MVSQAAVDRALAEKCYSAWTAPGVLVVRRSFYATKSVIQALEAKWPARKGEPAARAARRRDEMLAVIALWQSGSRLLPNDHIKPLGPPPVGADFVWELRARLTKPGARCLGFIPNRNIYVATGVWPRDTLGPRGSATWGKGIHFGHSQPKKWFPNDPVLSFVGTEFGQADLDQVCDVF